MRQISGDFLAIDRKIRAKTPSQGVRTRSVEERVGDFDDVVIPLDPESAMLEAARCVQCPDPAPCMLACPTHNDIPSAMWLIEQGQFLQAAQLYRQSSSLPEICGRVCPQEQLCQGSCSQNKSSLPVMTGALEAFVVDYARGVEGAAIPVGKPVGKRVRLEVNPLFVTGRYRKLVRDISQSKWFCSTCRGKGCEKCSGTGKMYAESVEDFVSKPLLEATLGQESFFHASGREDIDARMLGSGRPFVIEISKPKKRFIDFKIIETEIKTGSMGKVEVSDLNFASKDVVRRLKKGENSQKEYGLLAEFEKELTDSDLKLIEKLFSEVNVKQQTPQRVMHRRADLIRERYIYKVKVKKVSLKRALLEIRCQGGLYVKELVSWILSRKMPFRVLRSGLLSADSFRQSAATQYRPIRSRSAYTLTTLRKGCPPENRHAISQQLQSKNKISRRNAPIRCWWRGPTSICATRWMP